MKHFFQGLGAGGAAVGSAMLGIVSSNVLVLLLAFVLMISAYKIFS